MSRSPKPPEVSKTSTAFARFFRRPPKQSRSRALVEAVLVALEEQLNHAEDPNQWTLEALVDRAGVGVGSFYEYFSNKDSLLGVLVGHLTERNFESLLTTLRDQPHASLEGTVEGFVTVVCETYLARPRASRVVVGAIHRLGLEGPVILERDRFANELVRFAQPYLPNTVPSELQSSMRLMADAVMGVLTAELVRHPDPDKLGLIRDLTSMSLAILRTRHPESGKASESEGASP